MFKQISILFFLFYLVQSLEWDYDKRQRMYWSPACEFVGNDFKSIQSSKENCGNHCASSTKCTHFTWTTSNGGTCILRKGLRIISNYPYAVGALETNDISMYCGFKV